MNNIKYLQEIKEGCGHVCDECAKKKEDKMQEILENLSKIDKNSWQKCGCHCHSCHHRACFFSCNCK